MLLAPLANIISSKLQTRLTCLLGVLITSSALALTSITSDTTLLFIVYGIGVGFGLALIVNPPFFLLDVYFPYNHNRHVLATSLVACAFPLGKYCNS